MSSKRIVYANAFSNTRQCAKSSMERPFINVGPGDSIREELKHYGWEQKDLADIMGMTEKHISQLVRNKVPVTYETACQLSKAFKQTPQFWLNLDANYRQRLQA